MKVVMLCRRYAPHRGGVERHVEGLAKELIKRKFGVTMVTEQYATSLPLEEVSGKVKILRIPHDKLKGKRGIWAWMIAHKKTFEGADLIQAHDVFWWYLPLRFRFWDKPVYTTFHGYERVEGPTLGASLWRLLAHQLSDGTMNIGDWISAWYGTPADEVSYGAADAKQKPLPRKNSAVFIGRLADDTGIMEYIKGVKLLKGKVALDIFGEGPLKQQISHEIKSSRYIHLHGTTDFPAKEIEKHRFVFASQYLTMLEAQQTGRFVFAYRGTGIKPDYLSAYPGIGEVFVFGSAAELAEGLIQAKKLKQSKWAREQTWKKLAGQYQKLWKKSQS